MAPTYLALFVSIVAVVFAGLSWRVSHRVANNQTEIAFAREKAKLRQLLVMHKALLNPLSDKAHVALDSFNQLPTLKQSTLANNLEELTMIRDTFDEQLAHIKQALPSIAKYTPKNISLAELIDQTGRLEAGLADIATLETAAKQMWANTKIAIAAAAL